MRQRLRQIEPALPKADVTRLIVDGAGKQEYAGFAHKLLAKIMHVLLPLVTRETNGAGVRRGPFEQLGMPCQEGGKLAKIAQDDLEIAVNESLSMTEGESRQELAGRARANGGVVLEGDDFFEESRVVASEPAKTQAGEAVGLAHGPQADATVVEVAASGKAHCGIVLEFTVDLIAKDIDILATREVKDASQVLAA